MLRPGAVPTRVGVTHATHVTLQMAAAAGRAEITGIRLRSALAGAEQHSHNPGNAGLQLTLRGCVISWKTSCFGACTSQ